MSYSDPDDSQSAPDERDEQTVGDQAPEQPDEPFPIDAPLGDGENAIGATPPGFDWPTHGGYLGCLLGCLASFIIGGFLGSVLLGTLYVVGGGAALAMAVVALVVYVGVAYGLCRLGWLLGKRYYRSYQAPGAATWGEHDEFEYSNQAGERTAGEDDDSDGLKAVEMEGVSMTDSDAVHAEHATSASSDTLTRDEKDIQSGLPLASDGRRA